MNPIICVIWMGMAAKNIIPEIPPDPFGYTFDIDKNGTVDINLTIPPTANPLNDFGVSSDQ